MIKVDEPDSQLHGWEFELATDRQVADVDADAKQKAELRPPLAPNESKTVGPRIRGTMSACFRRQEEAASRMSWGSRSRSRSGSVCLDMNYVITVRKDDHLR